MLMSGIITYGWSGAPILCSLGGKKRMDINGAILPLISLTHPCQSAMQTSGRFVKVGQGQQGQERLVPSESGLARFSSDAAEI